MATLDLDSHPIPIKLTHTEDLFIVNPLKLYIHICVCIYVYKYTN